MGATADRIEWYRMQTQDGQEVLAMVTRAADGAVTAVPCEVSLVRGNVAVSAASPDAAAAELARRVAGTTRRELFGGTS